MLIPFLIVACSSNDEEEDCKSMPSDYECNYSSTNVMNHLNIRIIRNSLNDKVPIAIFEGSTVETGALVIKDTIKTNTVYELPDGNYAAYAIYNIMYEGELAKVIKPNDVRLSSKKEEYCEADCYEPDYEDIDLKLIEKYR